MSAHREQGKARAHRDLQGVVDGLKHKVGDIENGPTLGRPERYLHLITTVAWSDREAADIIVEALKEAGACAHCVDIALNVWELKR